MTHDTEHKITEYLCIGCPLGCRLEVEEDADGDVLEVRGFTCKKGRLYGAQEHTDPRRVVTTTVAIHGASWPRLPVKTDQAVPKALVKDICSALHDVKVVAPVTMGTVILADVLNTGSDVIASRDMTDTAY